MTPQAGITSLFGRGYALLVHERDEDAVLPKDMRLSCRSSRRRAICLAVSLAGAFVEAVTRRSRFAAGEGL